MNAAINPGRRPPQRLSSCLAAVLIGLAGCRQVELASDLDPAIATMVAARLQRHSVPIAVHPVDSKRSSLLVDENHLAQAIGELECKALSGADPCEPAEAPLLPSPHEEAARQRSLRECELARDLRKLPGVRDSRVRLGMEESRGLDDAVASFRASVFVEVAPDFEADHVRRYLRGAVAALDKSNIEIIAIPTTPPASTLAPALERLGPLRLTAASLPLAKAWLATLLGSNLLLAVVLMLTWHRYRRDKRDVDAQR